MSRTRTFAIAAAGPLVAMALAMGIALTSCTESKSSSAAGTDGRCTKSADCPASESCVYPIAQGCAATASCQPNPGGAVCNGEIIYCGCDGSQVGVGCGIANGYAPAPLARATPGTCPTPADAGSD